MAELDIIEDLDKRLKELERSIKAIWETSNPYFYKVARETAKGRVREFIEFLRPFGDTPLLKIMTATILPLILMGREDEAKKFIHKIREQIEK